MALFSRRGKSDESPSEPDASASAASGEPAASAVSAGQATASAGVDHESVPHVNISVSTFGKAPEKPAPPRPPRPEATAPAATQTIPGVVDNVLVQRALAALSETPQAAEVMNVMRQALVGQLYVRAQGDAQALLAEGKGLNLAITTFGDKRFLLAFSGGGPLQASAREEGSEAASAVGQSASHLLRTAVDSGYDGIYLDHTNPGARVVLPIELIRKSLEEGAPPPFELKTLLAGERTDAAERAIVDVLTRETVWVAGNLDPESGQIGLAEARGDSGRRIEVYSHPLEVIAMGRGDRPLPLTPQQLAKTLASEPTVTGIVIDAAGPWAELDREALAPLIALAD